MKYVNPEHNKEQGESESTQKKFLCFEKLTMIPIQKNLINVSLLTTKELDWVDAYHSEVFENVSPLLDDYSLAMKWLKNSCDKIDRSPIE
jgi:Xaa-Pro aminopeptidase